jgi:hypothetical protein
MMKPIMFCVDEQAGASLGFNLVGSLAAIDQWVEAMDSDDDHDDGGNHKAGAGAKAGSGRGSLNVFGFKTNDTSSSKSKSGHSSDGSKNSNKGSKVLSRDSIMSMVRNLTFRCVFVFVLTSFPFVGVQREYEYQ